MVANNGTADICNSDFVVLGISAFQGKRLTSTFLSSYISFRLLLVKYTIHAFLFIELSGFYESPKSFNRRCVQQVKHWNCDERSGDI